MVQCVPNDANIVLVDGTACQGNATLRWVAPYGDICYAEYSVVILFLPLMRVAAMTHSRCKLGAPAFLRVWLSVWQFGTTVFTQTRVDLWRAHNVLSERFAVVLQTVFSHFSFLISFLIITLLLVHLLLLLRFSIFIVIFTVIMMRAFFGSYYMDESAVDRSQWRDKSDAALRREHQAKALFDAFLQEAESMTTFPVTKDDLVPASIHLTAACWRSFKEYAVDKGCTAKRRVATMPERIATKDMRNGKMYVIAVTIPAHPSVAMDVALAKKTKDDAAIVKKKEEAAAKAKKKAEEAAPIMMEKKALEVKAKQEFNALVRAMFRRRRRPTWLRCLLPRQPPPPPPMVEASNPWSINISQIWFLRLLDPPATTTRNANNPTKPPKKNRPSRSLSRAKRSSVRPKPTVIGACTWWRGRWNKRNSKSYKLSSKSSTRRCKSKRKFWSTKRKPFVIVSRKRSSH
jgi:hypothetical protein